MNLVNLYSLSTKNLKNSFNRIVEIIYSLILCLAKLPHLTISDFKAVEKDMKVLSTKYQNLENKVDDLMAYLRTNSIEVPEFLK